MNNIFILTPISEALPPKTDKHYYWLYSESIDNYESGEYDYDDRRFRDQLGTTLTRVSHWARPLLPTETDEKEAEKYAKDGDNHGFYTIDKTMRRAFLAGILHERASGKKGDGECDHPWAFVQTKCMGEINKCLKCGKELGAY
jgi:hypothetical protein